MSLERIDEYMRQLTAITKYDKVCRELEKFKKELAERDQTIYSFQSFANSLLSIINDMQNELKEKDERIAVSNSIMDTQQVCNTLLENSWKEAQKKEKMTLMEKQSNVSRGFNLKNLFSLGIILDDKATILKRKMNAIYHWLLTNGLRLLRYSLGKIVISQYLVFNLLQRRLDRAHI